jgi:hypothetical protein
MVSSYLIALVNRIIILLEGKMLARETLSLFIYCRLISDVTLILCV